MPFPLGVPAAQADARQELVFRAAIVPYRRRQEFAFHSRVVAPEVSRQEFQFLAAVTAPPGRQEFTFRARVLGLPWAPLPPEQRQVHTGQAGARVTLSCFLGAASSGEYTWTADSETATLTYDARLDLDHLPAEIELTMSSSAGGSFRRRLHLDRGQSAVEWGDEGAQTTLRLYNPAMLALGDASTPEYIPWHQSGWVRPTGNIPRLPATYGVSQAVRDVFKHAGLRFGLRGGGDPLAGARWQEGVRDYSTAGVTPKAAFDATYGALGYQLVLDGPDAYALPPGQIDWPVSVSCTQRAETRVRQQLGSMPSRLELSGPDQARFWRPPGGAGGEPEPVVTSQWRTEGNDIAKTYTKTTSRGNLLLSQWVVTTGRVEILRTTETGEVYIDPRSGALLTATVTENTYHPEWPTELVRSLTTKWTVGYYPNVKTSQIRVSDLTLTAGDVIPTDTALTTKQWYGVDSPEEVGDLLGYLRRTATVERKLKSFQQKNPQTPEAGKLDVGEYSSQSKVEEYFTQDGRLWTRVATMDGGNATPVVDSETGEAVYAAERTSNQLREVESGVVPPRIDMERPGQHQGLKDVQVPRPLRAAFNVGGAQRPGQGTESVEFAWAESVEQLTSYAAILARRWSPRETISQALVGALNVRVGRAISVDDVQYAVTEVRVQAGEGGEMRVKGERLTTRLSAYAAPQRPLPQQGIYAGRTPEGLRVLLPPAKDGGEWQPVLVAFRGQTPALYSVVTLAVSADGFAYIKEGG